MSETPPPAPNPTPDPTPTPTPTPGYDAAGPVADPADVEKNKVMAILAYIGILVLVPLLAAKDSPFARYHANQGLILLICAIVSGFAMGLIVLVAAWVPVVNICAGCVLPLAHFAAVVTLIIMGIINAANGRMKPLPVIGTLFTILK